MVRVFRGRLSAAAFIVSAAAAGASAGVTGSGAIAPSNYYGFQPPARGGSYADPSFGSTITRLSAALSSPNADGGGNLTWILNEYSTPAIWNSANSYFLLQHNSYFALYSGSGAYLRDIPFDVNSSTEPRWSRSDPSVIYYKRGNALKAYNVGTGAISVVRAFTEYGSISGKGESDICFDGDHMVLVGDNRDVFVYTISANQKGPVFNTAGNGFDSVYIASDDTVTITWLANGTGRYRGIELFDRNMNFLRQVARAGGHMDMARDVDGSAVLVWTNSNDPAPICDNGIVKIRLADAQQTCLVELDWNLAVHIAGSDAGWALVSTYAPSDPNPSGFWPPYTNEIFRVRLDGSVVERLAHHRSRPFNGYNYMSKATLSRDASRVIYASNYGLQAILGYPSEYSDAYLMQVGGGAAPPPPTPVPTTPPTPTPTPTPGSRVEETSGSVQYTGTWQSQSKGVHSGGATALTRAAGAESTVWFNGTGVVWRGVRDPWSGQAQVYVDGVLRGTVDMYSANETPQDTLYTVTGLSAGTHRFTVRCLGTQNAASTDSWVWVDAFDVIGGTGATPGPTASPTPTPVPTAPTATPTPLPGASVRLEQTSTSVTFTGTWQTQNKGVHSGNSTAMTREAGAEATVWFTGTSVVWRGVRDPWSGQAQVYLDGVLKGTVDMYSATETADTALYTSSGLAAGAHNLKIRVLGTRNAASTDNWVWVDAFDVVGAGATPAPSPTGTPAPPPPGAVPVIWTNVVGVTASGGSLVRGPGAPGWTAGAASTQQAASGDAGVEFTASETSSYRLVGLSNGDANQSYTDIDFAIYPAGDGQVYVFEAGVYRGVFGAYQPGDRLAVEVQSGAVRYKRNGLVLWSNTSPTLRYPLRVDSALYSAGATVTGALAYGTLTAGSGANVPPTASAGGSYRWTAGQAISFDGTGSSDADGTITAYSWAFGDGGTGSGAAPSHTYATAGSYTVTLTVTDNAGATASATASVVVSGTRPTRNATWRNVVGVNAAAGSLQKAGAAGWDAGAISTQSLASGDGYVQTTIGETNTYRLFGFSNGDANQSYDDVDFALCAAADGKLYVFEKGVLKAQAGPYAAGDRLRVSVDGGVVRYLKNGRILATGGQAPSYPLVVDTSFYNPGATLGGVLVAGVAGAAPVANAGGPYEWSAGQPVQFDGTGSADADGGIAAYSWSFGDGSSGAGAAPQHTYAAAGTYTGSLTVTDEDGTTHTATFPVVVDARSTASVTWTSAAGVSVSGGTLVKTAAAGWDAGAVSSQAIASGDGYVQCTVNETNTYRLVGLGNVDSSRSYEDVDFALYPAANGVLYVFENGVNRGAFGAYAPGDRLRVAVRGGALRYIKNGRVLHVSSAAPTYPLRADTSFYTPSGSLAGAVLTTP